MKHPVENYTDVNFLNRQSYPYWYLIAFLMAERLKLLAAVRDTAGNGTFSILISDVLNPNSIGEFVWN
jgi:hypothetical protein